MLVYEKPGEGGSAPDPIETSPNPEIQLLESKLSKLGITGVTPEILKRIGANTESQKALQTDLDGLLTQNPPDSGELARIDTLYIKGFGQVVEINGKSYTFAEIAALPGEKQVELLGDVKNPLEKIRIGAYINEVANTKKEVEIAGEKAESKEADEAAMRRKAESSRNTKNLREAEIANQKDKELENQLIELNSKLESSTNTIRSLSSLPPGIEQKALAEAETNPPKELAGVAPEQYGEYKNLILANYTISHADEIEKSLNVNDKKAFGNSVDEMSGIIGRKPADWPRIVETSGGLVLGESREQIRDLGDRYIRDGYDKSVVWDSQSRSLIFRGAEGEKIIDTATIPPRERISMRGLSISRDMTPVSPEQKAKNNLLEKQNTIISQITKDVKDTHLAELSTDTIPSTLQQESIISEHKSLQAAYINAKNPEEKLMSIRALKENNRKIETARKNELNIDMSSTDITNQDALETSLYQEFIDLTKIELDIAAFIKNYEELQSYKNLDIKKDTFDSTARTNLDWLTSEDTLFQRMGPEGNRALYRMIDTINRGREPANQISLSNSVLSITDKQKLQESYKKLGGDITTLRDGEKIRAFQQKISIAVEKPVGASGSIESLLMTPETKAKTPEKSEKKI